jgi:hypothetical protein
VTTFLIEAYTSSSASVPAIEERARRAAHGVAGVTYERSIFIPEDELCFHLVEAPSREVVATVAALAGIEPVRVVETAS